MATLLELDAIEKNSRRPVDPADPPEVGQARDLRAKMRVAALKVARAILVDPTPLPDSDSPEPGSPAQPTRTERLERIAWARRTVENPDAAVDGLMRLALAGIGPGVQAGAILAASDEVLQSGITPLIPVLAKGLQVTR